MAGNTGKMTAEAVRARGPRMRLASIVRRGRCSLGLVIFREDTNPIAFTASVVPVYYARSYSLKYLLDVGRGQQMEAPGV